MKIQNRRIAVFLSVIRTMALMCLGISFLADCAFVHAQQKASGKPLMLVTWFGPGAIALPDGPGWKPEMLTVYDNIQRPVAEYTKDDSGLTVSFILFENRSGKPSAAGCREDAINPILEHDAKLISNRVDREEKSATGETLATTSYLLDMRLAGGHHQHNLFGFVGDSKTCAEIHISSVVESPSEEAAMMAVLAEFRPDLKYTPNYEDYFRIASILYKGSPNLAAPYYDASLKVMPNDASHLTLRRVATDQIVMSLGMTGDLKNSRAYAERAIASDPDYPLNYYNLACADAEEGNATQARAHLSQAFDRRANVIMGESMPDPTKDDSILKLKKDKAFWAFVTALPKK